MVSKEDFMKKMLFMERVKKIRQGRIKDREVRVYGIETYADRNKGKQDTWRRRGIIRER